MSAIPAGYKQTEVGVIPEDWIVQQLGDIATIKDGTHQTPRYVASGVPFFSVEHVTSGDFKNTKFISEKEHRFLTRTCKIEKGDILMTRIGSIGDCKLIDWDVDASFYVSLALLKIQSGCSSAYIAQYSKSASFQNEVLLHSLQSAIPKKINLGPISSVKIAVPSLPEQRDIAAALSDVDALIAKLDQLIAKKRDLKQAAMQQLLTGQTRLPGFDADCGYKRTEFGAIPDDWQVRPLLTAVRIAEGQADPKIEPYKSMLLVGPAHVESGTGKLIARQTASEQGAISGKYLFSAGDIVYGKINPYLQKAFLADSSGLCSADMYPLKPLNDVASGFMLAVILGRQFTKYAESVSVRSGMPKINRDEMGRFSFPLPSDKTEQTAIATVLSDMDAELTALEARRDKTRALKQGMMQELLTGRIRLVNPEKING